MIVDEIKLFELLKAKIGAKEAEAFVQLLETKVNGKVAQVEKGFKDDIISLKEHIDNRFAIVDGRFANIDNQFANVNKVFATKEDLANLRAEFKEDIANLRTEFKADIANSKAEIIKWMFIFWVGQIGVMIALLTVFFKH